MYTYTFLWTSDESSRCDSPVYAHMVCINDNNSSSNNDTLYINTHKHNNDENNDSGRTFPCLRTKNGRRAPGIPFGDHPLELERCSR